uniref:Diguanylate cyclase/phosphodiesterase with extracellular sensor n=1 Tax=Cyanothece sp. (strain PCC 7425 / ATCC 29141) TaxID=395961 RepID=B8HP72_CYAP4
MTLRKKAIWVISLTFLVIFLVLYAIGTTIVREGFARVEQQMVSGDVQRVLQALNADLNHLDSTAADWAMWDETYAFIQNLDPQYIQTNLSAQSLVNLRLNLILFLEAGGKLAYARSVDLNTGQIVPLNPTLVNAVSNNPRLLQPRSQDRRQGLLILPDSTLLLAARPILTSQRQGPVRGTLILGQYLDQEKITELSERTKQSPILFYPYHAAHLPEEVRRIQTSLTPAHPIVVRPLSETLVAGYGLIMDIYEQPGLLLQINLPRSVHQQGELSLRVFLGVLLLTGLVCTIATWLLMEKLVLTRLGHLTAGVQKIQFSQNPSWRLKVIGGDELARLADGINQMLAALEASQQELQYTQQQYHWQANHDPLTELPNRRSFEQTLRASFTQSQRTQQEHVLCLVDLDRFKLVNDTSGHAAGDELLKQISLLLKTQIRQTDVVARLGGDEFGIIFYHCSLDAAQRLAQKLQSSLATFRFVWQDRVFTVGASLGLAQISAHVADLAEVMTAADLACYTAKKQGGNRVHIHRIGSQALASQLGEVHWAVQLRQAIENNRFCLYSQPIVPINRCSCQTVSGTLDPTVEPREATPIGATNPAACTSQSQPYLCQEVLLHLYDETNQVIDPNVFLPIAEQYGLITVIDRWAIHNLFAYIQAQHYPAATLDSARGYRYAINLSGRTLDDASFADFLLEQLAAYQVPPAAICFEITETAAIANLKLAMPFIQTLKAAGCLFALDDFGGGMSSFAYLKNLPVDYLKIDGTLIKDLSNNPVNYYIVQAINDIAHTMGIQTIAEGVDSLDTLSSVSQIGIDFAQGHYIAQPVPL